jgi:hypothetical protein
MQRVEHPPIEPEQMDVGDRIARAEHPTAAELGIGDAVDLPHMIEALLARRMQGRGDERHP